MKKLPTRDGRKNSNAYVTGMGEITCPIEGVQTVYQLRGEDKTTSYMTRAQIQERFHEAEIADPLPSLWELTDDRYVLTEEVRVNGGHGEGSTTYTTIVLNRAGEAIAYPSKHLADKARSRLNPSAIACKVAVAEESIQDLEVSQALQGLL